MTLVHILIFAVLLAGAGAWLFGAGTRTSDAESNTAGPTTLEELFAARFARGDIDGDQYRTHVQTLSAHLHR